MYTLVRSTISWKMVLIFSVILHHIAVPTVLSVQSRWIEHVAWHNNIIAAASSEDIWLYDDVTLQEVAFIDRSVGLTDIEWDPSSDRLAFSGGDGYSIELAVWNLATQQYEWQISVNKSYSYSVLPIRWSPNGQYLALGLYEELHIYDGNTGNLIHVLPDFGIEEVAGIAWSPAGDRLVTTTVKTIKVWDTSTWNLITVLAEDSDFWRVEWIAGSTQVAVEHDFDIEIWDISSLQLVTTLDTNHNSVVHSLVWDISGGLASASYDGVIHIWDIDSRQATSTLTVNDVRAMDWSPDGSQLVYGGRDDLLEVKALPTANAGPDQTLTDIDGNGTELVTLDSTASTDPDGSIVSYDWQLDGSTITVGANPQVELPVGEHTITLVVTDNDGLVDIDEVVITIEGAP